MITFVFFLIYIDTDAGHARHFPQRICQSILSRDAASVQDQTDHDLACGKSFAEQHMAEQPFSGLLIISRDLVCFHMIQNLLQDDPVFLHAQPAFRARNDPVAPGRIESGHGTALFICSKWKLRFIPVPPGVFHAQDLRLGKPGQATDTGQVIPYFIYLISQLRFIVHGLELTSAALTGVGAAGLHPIRRRFQYFHQARVAVSFFHLHDLRFHPVADHRILYEECHAVQFSDPFSVNAQIFDGQFYHIILFHRSLLLKMPDEKSRFKPSSVRHIVFSIYY